MQIHNLIVRSKLSKLKSITLKGTIDGKEIAASHWTLHFTESKSKHY